MFSNLSNANKPTTPGGVFPFWQSLFGKKQSSQSAVGQLVVGNRTSAKSEEVLLAPLYNLKVAYAQQAFALAQQSRYNHEQAENCFNTVKAVDDQIDCLIELAEINTLDADSPAWTMEMLQQLHALQETQRNWVEEGAAYQERANRLAQVADGYSKLVIELQICIYKTRELPTIEAQKTAHALVAAFQERCNELESRLNQPQEMSQEVVHEAPALTVAAE
jgi:hypothetical protein